MEFTSNEIFAERITQLRVDNKKTQQDVADDTGIHVNSIKNYEKGRLPKTRELLILRDYYNVSINYLTGESNVKKIDDDFQMIGKATGLSDKSLEVLKYSDRLNGKRKDIINFLIENESKYKFLSTLEMFLNSKLDNKQFNKIIRKSVKENTYDTKEINKRIKENSNNDTINNNLPNGMISEDLSNSLLNGTTLSDMLKCDLDRIIYKLEEDYLKEKEKK